MPLPSVRTGPSHGPRSTPTPTGPSSGTLPSPSAGGSHARQMPTGMPGPPPRGAATPRNIHDMPSEILQHIATHLRTPKLRETGANFNAFANSSPLLKSVLSNDIVARFMEPLTKKLTTLFANPSHAEALAASAAVRVPVGVMSPRQRADAVAMARRHPGLVCALGPELAKLEPAERSTLCRAAMSIADKALQAQAISRLGTGGLHLLKAHEQKQLVEQLEKMDDAHFVAALEGVGSSLGHLERDLRLKVLGRAMSIQEPADAEVALRHLSPAMAHPGSEAGELLPSMAQYLVQNHPDSQAMSTLCSHFEHLSVPVRSALFDMAMHKPDPESRAKAVSGFASAMQHLEPGERNDLFDTIAESADPMRLFTTQGAATVPGRATPPWTGIQHLDDGRRDTLVDLATGPGKSATSLRAMASGMPWLTTKQRGAVFEAALQLPPAERAQVWAGMGPVMGLLTRSQKAQMVTDIVHHQHGDAQAAAVAGVGPGLVHLGKDEQQALLGTLDGMATPLQKAQAMAGLCDGWADVAAARPPVPGRPSAPETANDVIARFLQPLTREMSATFESTANNMKIFGSPAARLPLARLSPQERSNFVSLSRVFAGEKILDPQGRPIDVGCDYTDQGDREFGLVCALGRGLASLTPGDRTRVYEQAAVGLQDEAHRAVAISNLAVGGLQHLQEKERRHVVGMLGQMSGANVVAALEGFGQSLGALDKELQTHVVFAVHQLTDPAQQEAALRHLSAGYAHLDPELQQLLASMAFNLAQNDPDSHAMSALCGAFEHVAVPVRNALFDQAAQKPDPEARAAALAGFAPALQHLDPDQRNAVVDALKSSADPMRLFTAQGAATEAGRFPPPWQGLQPLDDTRRGELVALATGPDKSATSLRAMASGMPWLKQPQRDAVFNAVFELDAAQRAQVWAGIGPVVEKLTPSQKERMVADIAGQLQGADQAAAVAGAGAGLAHLAKGEQQALLDTLKGLDDPVHRSQAMAGLADGWPAVAAKHADAA
jgi:hypothetical protein